MRSLRIWVPVAFLYFLLSIPFPIFAGEPMAQLSASINEFVTIMSNTSVAELRATGLPEKARQLVFEEADFSPAVEAANPLHESRQAALNFDCWRIVPQRFRVEVSKDQTRFGSPRQANFNCVPCGRVSNATGLDFK